MGVPTNFATDTRRTKKECFIDARQTITGSVWCNYASTGSSYGRLASECEDSALPPEFGQTVVVFGLPRPKQQSSNPALWQAVGDEIVVTNFPAYA